MTKRKFISIPIIVAGLLLTGASGAIIGVAADDTVNRKLAEDSNIGPFINANIGPFTVRNLGTDAAWVINTNPGGIGS